MSIRDVLGDGKLLFKDKLIDVGSLKDNKLIGIYFSAHW